MKWLQSWAMKEKGVLVGNIIFSLFISFAIIIQSAMIVKVVDAVFINKNSFQSLLPLFGILIGAIVLRVLFNSWNNYLGVKMSMRVKKKVRQALLKKWEKNPLQSSMKGQAGSKVTMLVEMIDQLESFYRDYMPQVIKSIIVPIVLLVAVTMTHFYSGLILLFTAPLIPVAYIIVGMQTQKKSEKQLMELSNFSGKFLDLVQGLQTLKLFGQGKKQRDELEKSNRTFQKSTMGILKVAFASTFFIELVVTLGIGLIAIEIAYQMITFETMHFAEAFFILAIAPEFYNSIKDLGSAFHTGRGSMAAAEVIEKELNTQDQPVQWGEASLGALPKLEIKNGQFSYDEHFAMKDLNLVIEPRSRVAIIGPTGQGKSTLLNILSGVYELEQGEIRINDKLRSHYSQDQWFTSMSYISQNPYLFTGTVAENIAMAQGEFDENRMKEAIELAQLDQWVAALPNDVHTNIGEGGRALSGGEKQRVAIARAFYKQPKIVFFDEPTMGLDLQTEQLLQNAMDEFAKTTTMITVAHRLHTIVNADQIIVVNKGCIEMTGTHTQLQKESKLYREMIGGEQYEGTH